MEFKDFLQWKYKSDFIPWALFTFEYIFIWKSRCRQSLEETKWIKSIRRTSFSAGNQLGCICTFLTWFSVSYRVYQTPFRYRKLSLRGFSQPRNDFTQRIGSVTFRFLSKEQTKWSDLLLIFLKIFEWSLWLGPKYPWVTIKSKCSSFLHLRARPAFYLNRKLFTGYSILFFKDFISNYKNCVCPSCR